MTFLELVRANAERIWSHVDVRGEDECWPWVGAPNKGGYGQIDLSYRVGGVRFRHAYNAHRVVFALGTGIDPGPRLVRHTCDYRLCCNWKRHLIPGTQTDNMADCVERGRFARGESSPLAFLDDDDVRQIRALCASGRPQTDVGTLFGVSQGAVSLIVRRKRWAHI